MSMRLNDEAMRQFRVGGLFKDSEDLKLSLDFSFDGKRLLVCDHSVLSIINTTCQVVLSQVNMHRYRPDVACFTHRDSRILHSTSKNNFSIRYLDLKTHGCICRFRGHKKNIRSLATQPEHANMFLSSGEDDQVYVWDLRSSKHTFHFTKLHRPLCAFSPTGSLLATTDSNQLFIYDVRKLGKIPCSTYCYSAKDKAAWTQLQFSPDGKTLLISTDNSWCFSVSAFDGSFQQSFTGYSNEQRLPLEATYSPDSQFILSGADAGRIHVWRAADGKPVAVLEGNNVGPVKCLRFNPRATMFVSSDVLVAFWMPMANGTYDWVEPLESSPPNVSKGEKKDEPEDGGKHELAAGGQDPPKDDHPVPKAIALPAPLIDWEKLRRKYSSSNWRDAKRVCNEEPLAVVVEKKAGPELEEGEIREV
ncbi:WD repeat-containing protein 82 [Drosophila bipectinata]|uniref:WD repeat-containing protein 82 n=1 Tax=Drosophila bipectinata TaxID=42026 RepID=UPI001C8AC1CB|nr:WD repeat-containing protein 82 [Drosophila bipectinata]